MRPINTDNAKERGRAEAIPAVTLSPLAGI